MCARFRYTLDLPAQPNPLRTEHPTGGMLRHPLPTETELLAELMLDAYRDTTDSEGESSDDALIEVEGFFAGQSGEPLIDCSWVYASSATLLSASLITLFEGTPLVAYLMTRSPWKGRGLASYLLRQSLLSLQDQHFTAVTAFVTDGNAPSEGLLRQFGFERSGGEA